MSGAQALTTLQLYRHILRAARQFPSVKRERIINEIKTDFRAKKVTRPFVRLVHVRFCRSDRSDRVAKSNSLAKQRPPPRRQCGRALALLSPCRPSPPHPPYGCAGPDGRRPGSEGPRHRGARPLRHAGLHRRRQAAVGRHPPEGRHRLRARRATNVRRRSVSATTLAPA